MRTEYHGQEPANCVTVADSLVARRNPKHGLRHAHACRTLQILDESAGDKSADTRLRLPGAADPQVEATGQADMFGREARLLGSKSLCTMVLRTVTGCRESRAGRLEPSRHHVNLRSCLTIKAALKGHLHKVAGVEGYETA